VPGSVFVEMVLCAGDWVGCELVDELLLSAPLSLPQRGGMQIQVSVGTADEQGRHRVRIHSRAEDAPLDAIWALHATGTLARAESVGEVPANGLEVWPPRDAEAVDPKELYERMAAAGLEYGPAFRALQSVWRRGTEVFGEARLDGEPAQTAERFGLHPALFDAALHPLWLLRNGPDLPFAYSGVRLHASGAVTLRVRLADDNGSATVTAVDRAGRTVLTADAVVTRPAHERQMAQGSDDAAADVLMRVEWVEISGAGSVLPGLNGAAVSSRVAVLGVDPADLLGELPAGERRVCPAWESLTAELDRGWIPDVVVALCDVDTPTEAGLVAAVRSGTEHMLARIQQWLAEERLENAQLVLVTRHALEGDAAQLVGAPAWGLARSAQSEHPGRFVLIDLDQTASASLVTRAVTVARAGDEPQLVIRNGEVRVPRLTRVERPEATAPDVDGTWLITGGTGALGRGIARHLVFEHGADDLVLLARRSTAAEWIVELPASVRVEVVPCDVADRAHLDRVLARLTAEGRRLAGVVHAAGTLDDGVIQSLDHERLGAVLRPKVDGAWNLHEATLGMDLSQFVLFSSAASVFGGAGQGNYAAANAFLDALAQYRHTQGLPATSIAWGLWEQDAGMAGQLNAADRARMRRTGLLPLSPEIGLRVFDLARFGDRPTVVATPIDVTGLRTRAAVPAPFRALIRRARLTADNAGSGGRVFLREQLAGLPLAEQSRLMLDLVRSEAALVLGSSGPDDIGPEKAFSELGLDSLTAVELRNRLNTRAGQRIPATVVFDYPTSRLLADFLLTRLTDGAATPPVDDRELVIRRMLADLSYDKLRQLGIIDLLTDYTGGTPGGTDAPDEPSIEEMDIDELIQIVDRD
jgi:Short-chain dehydrogenases of various substrate specificities